LLRLSEDFGVSWKDFTAVSVKAVCPQHVAKAVTVTVTYAYHDVFYWHKIGTLLMETEHFYVAVYKFP
jgi:hypothetical protein